MDRISIFGIGWLANVFQRPDSANHHAILVILLKLYLIP